MIFAIVVVVCGGGCSWCLGEERTIDQIVNTKHSSSEVQSHPLLEDGNIIIRIATRILPFHPFNLSFCIDGIRY